MKHGLFVLLVLFSGPASLLAAASGELTLMVETVLARNPGIKAAEAQARSARHGLREARALSLPSLRAESLLIRSDNPVFAFGTLLQQRSFAARYFDVGYLNRPGYLTDVRSSVELGVPLFTGFALHNSRRLAALGVQQAERRTDAASQGARFRVVNGYLTALLKEQQLASLESRIAEASREVDDANRLKAKGLVPGSDYYAAEAILAGLNTWRVRISAEREAAFATLAVLTDQPGHAPFKLRLSENVYAVPCETELVQEALRLRRDVQGAALQAESAGLARRLETAGLLPRVEAFSSVATHTEDFSRSPSDRTLGVKASLAFGDPAVFARRARAQAVYEAGLAARGSVEENARIEVAQALAGYRGAAESLASAKRALERAQQSLELFRPLYREGRQSIMEVLRAEEGVARAEFNYWEVLYGVHAGYAQMLAAAGRMGLPAVTEIEQHLEAVK